MARSPCDTPSLGSLTDKRTAWAGNCDSTQYGCEGTGRWEPDHCKVAGANCATLFHVYPEYAIGWVEQLINNLNLNISVYYAGWDVYQTVRDADAANQPTMFYSWSPHEFLASNKYVRITFPENTQRCKNKDTYTRFGGMDCDQKGEDVFKLSSAELAKKSLAAAKFVEMFNIGLDDQESMLADLAAGGDGGTMTTDESVCNWAKTVRKGACCCTARRRIALLAAALTLARASRALDPQATPTMLGMRRTTSGGRSGSMR